MEGPSLNITPVNLQYQLKGLELINESNACLEKEKIIDEVIASIGLAALFTTFTKVFGDYNKNYHVTFGLFLLVPVPLAFKAYYKQHSVNLLSQASSMFHLSNGKSITNVVAFKDPRV